MGKILIKKLKGLLWHVVSKNVPYLKIYLHIPAERELCDARCHGHFIRSSGLVESRPFFDFVSPGPSETVCIYLHVATPRLRIILQMAWHDSICLNAFFCCCKLSTVFTFFAFRASFSNASPDTRATNTKELLFLTSVVILLQLVLQNNIHEFP